MDTTAIVWLRRDLRVADNPALAQAMAECERVLPLYIHAPDEETPWAMGAASRWWLHGSLASLARSLAVRGSRLAIGRGASLDFLLRAVESVGASRVYWSRLYDPATRERDSRIKSALRERGIRCKSFNSLLLREPWEVSSTAGEPYRVYSAFRRHFGVDDVETGSAAAPVRWRPAPEYAGVELDALKLLPKIRWDLEIAERWTPGEDAAIDRARVFVARDLDDYAERRDLPGISGTSSLSPHLHFGEIGPRQLLALIREHPGGTESPGADTYVRELLWREFAYHLLYGFPHTPEEPLDPRFARFPWREGDTGTLLAAWQMGGTGIPLVDAGMRELWSTGWMHNRVRMAVASFLVKNLRIPWQEGARWFWDTLVDADLANNTLGWQWTAGCGADAAPYFRIFNPVRQGERFDADGTYVRRWCPELSRLPSRYIHAPWAAPAEVLRSAGVALGREYPSPIVDLGHSREEALSAFEAIKGA